MSQDPKRFSLEMDDRTDEERAADRAKAKAAKKMRGKCCFKKQRGPMDTDFIEDHGVIPCQIGISLDFNKTPEELAEQKKNRFTLANIYCAVSTGDVSRLEGLHEYLKSTQKKLSDKQYCPNGRTPLLKALLNLKHGENDTVKHLLDIAEKTGDLKKLVNAAHTDCYYSGQSPLHVAIERRSLKFAELLLQKGANVHARACGTFFQPHHGMCFYFGELPLSLAACTNQMEMVNLLMDNPYDKADVRQKDSLGNTVLHALVVVADNSPENTEFVKSMYDYILTKDAHLNHKCEKLEDFKNNQGLTPIKLAAKTGKIGLFEHILHREFQQEECRQLSRKFTEWAYGPVYASLYDLDSLDTCEENSVLEIIAHGTEIPNRLEMLQVEPLNQLLDDKWGRFAYKMFVFNFLFYLAYLIIFTLVCHYHSQEKDNLHTPETIEDYLELTGHVIIAAGSIYFFFKGIVDMKRKPPRMQTLLIDGYSDLLFFFQGLLYLICAALYFCGKEEHLSLLVICLALSWINLLYFSRGSQHMGIYSVMMQRMMLGDLIRFLFVYMVFLFGFAAAVMTLLNKAPNNETATQEASKTTSTRSFFTEDNSEDCKKPTYRNITFTIMELFKFTIGMGDLEFTEEYHDKTVFYLLLISYIVLTYILLLNMLIAIMSKTVEKLSQESTRIWKLQRAITILDLERSLTACLPCHCLKTKLRSGVKKNLGKIENDERWCLRVEEVNWKEWSRNVGIINEDPGNLAQASPEAPPEAPQRGQTWRGFLRDFSRRRPSTKTHQEEQEVILIESRPV